MTCQDARSRNCKGADVQRVRIEGDRRAYVLCRDCRAIYALTPFFFKFVPADAPDSGPAWLRNRTAKDFTTRMAS